MIPIRGYGASVVNTPRFQAFKVRNAYPEDG
jgi:hypothetical protein